LSAALNTAQKIPVGTLLIRNRVWKSLVRAKSRTRADQASDTRPAYVRSSLRPAVQGLLDRNKGAQFPRHCLIACE
jgi:hypothetical protein